MLGLTPLGTFHTAIGLIAVVAGILALVRHQEITETSTRLPREAPLFPNAG